MILKACLMEPVYTRYSGEWNTGTPVERAEAIHAYTEACDREIRRLGHDLRKSWSRFKRLHASVAGLSAFDMVVKELDDWWSVRYPNFPRARSVMMTTSRVRTTSRPSASPRADRYDLCLEDMDEMFEVTVPLTYTTHAVRLAIGSMNPSAIKDDYLQENRHPLLLPG